MTGQRFGKLLVLKTLPAGRCVCLCDCGTEKTFNSASVRYGRSQTCGCSIRIHGQSSGARGRTATYRTWTRLRERCHNPNTDSFERYGGRGISVCSRWNSFANFLADMGEQPDGCSIDRIDVDGDYEPSNCRWATDKEQARNRSTNVLLEFDGRTQCVRAWEDEMGYPERLIKNRLATGWTVERAISQPVTRRFKK